jgi:hypothetical protein
VSTQTDRLTDRVRQTDTRQQPGTGRIGRHRV